MRRTTLFCVSDRLVHEPSLPAIPTWSWSRAESQGAPLPEQVVLGGDERVADRRLPPRGPSAADERRGAARGLAEDELGRRRELVRDGADGRAHHATIGVRRPAQVVERQETGHAERDVDDAPSPWPPERVRDDDGNVDTKTVADCYADPARGGVGVDRQQRHDVAAVGP